MSFDPQWFSNQSTLSFEAFRAAIGEDEYHRLRNLPEPDDELTEFLHSIGFHLERLVKFPAQLRLQFLQRLFQDFPGYGLLIYINHVRQDVDECDHQRFISWIRTTLSTKGPHAEALIYWLTLDIFPDSDMWTALTTQPLNPVLMAALMEASGEIPTDEKRALIDFCTSDSDYHEAAWRGVEAGLHYPTGILDLSEIKSSVARLLQSETASNHPECYNRLYWHTWLSDRFADVVLKRNNDSYFSLENARKVLDELRGAGATVVAIHIAGPGGVPEPRTFVPYPPQEVFTSIEDFEEKTFQRCTECLDSIRFHETIREFAFEPISRDKIGVLAHPLLAP